MTVKALNNIKNNYQMHPFHLVENSPWPLITSISLLTFTFSAVLAFHNQTFGGYLLLIGFISVASSMFFWFTDVIREGKWGPTIKLTYNNKL